jgi:hypothetical protein
MITEALLEMHFHSSLVELFSSTFGKKFLRLLKPSPQNERWVGFDQGWIHTSLSMNEFFNDLKSAIQANQTSINKLYLAYFFQFKPVQRLTRNSRLKPAIYGTPYYRSELDLDPNPTTGISQHETLTKLCTIANTEVNYACPMLFDLDEIYEKPDLNKLQLVKINSAPTGWSTNQRHFIMFQSESDNNPLWCSTPVEGKSYNIHQFLERSDLRLLTSEELSILLANINTVLDEALSERKFGTRLNRIENYYPDCFTILEFSSNGS